MNCSLPPRNLALTARKVGELLYLVSHLQYSEVPLEPLVYFQQASSHWLKWFRLGGTPSAGARNILHSWSFSSRTLSHLYLWYATLVVSTVGCFSVQYLDLCGNMRQTCELTQHHPVISQLSQTCSLRCGYGHFIFVSVWMKVLHLSRYYWKYSQFYKWSFWLTDALLWAIKCLSWRHRKLNDTGHTVFALLMRSRFL